MSYTLSLDESVTKNALTAHLVLNVIEWALARKRYPLEMTQLNEDGSAWKYDFDGMDEFTLEEINRITGVSLTKDKPV
jgi:hypothetical protein